MFSRYIEVRPNNDREIIPMGITSFTERGARYISMSFNLPGKHQPQILGEINRKIADLCAKGALTSIQLITTSRMSNGTEASFRRIAERKIH